jgi:outer membrane protein assembly factor BamE (lipoprotein component of BamABCDE complex)
MVQDDFQLICWDFVSEPSTPGAFMMREGREFTRKQLNEIFNKSDRIDRIFNDIMEWK